jgi:hypothetical protein
MLFKEVKAVYSGNQMKPINTSTALLTDTSDGTYIVTIRLLKVNIALQA